MTRKVKGKMLVVVVPSWKYHNIKIITFHTLCKLSNFSNQICYTDTTYLQYLILIIFYIFI